MIPRPSASTALLLALVGLLIIPAGPASADIGDERTLAEKYAPVMHLVDQSEACGPGEPYRPSDVEPLMDNPSVALRGPWDSNDLVTVGPSADDISEGLFGWALDLPGDPLKPGCSYEEWADRTFADTPTTVYSHVTTQADHPDRLALQYWFYYPFNDFNNKHESDWESVQLEWDVGTPGEALTTDPVRAVYSAHEGSERADWGDPKIELVDGTHPRVYVASGSHSSHFNAGLFLLRSSEQGLGCDSTLGTSPLEPVVQTIPSDPDEAVAAYPWIGFEGRWGQKQERSFYDGPGGPNEHQQWLEPFTWSDRSADRSYPVPGGSVYGVKTTDFFCGAVSAGSVWLLRLTSDPARTLLVLALAVGLAVWVVRRTSWGTSSPWPLVQRRTVGQVMADAWSAYLTRPLLFLGIGGVVALVAVPTGLLGQYFAGDPTSDGEYVDAQTTAAVVTLATSLVLGVAVLFQQAATVVALRCIAEGRPVGVVAAYRGAVAQWRPLLLTALLWVTGLVVLALTLFLAVLAPLLVVAWSLFVPVIMVANLRGPAALRRSWRLVKGQFGRVLLLLVLASLAVSFVGGLSGTLVLLVAQAPFLLINLLPGVVSALLGPLVSLCTAFLYFHARAGEQEQEDAEPTPAPAAPR